jgi:hypothetical protein
VENELVLAGEPERAALRRLLELYRYYFSERGGADVGQHGGFAYRYLDVVA